MASGFRKFSGRMVILLNIVTVVFFLLASLASYIDPGKYWIIGILGVGFVFFLIAVLLFLVILLFMRSKWAWLSVAALLVCWSQIYAVLGLNFFSAFNQEREAGTLRVLQWNVTSWDEIDKSSKKKLTHRLEMLRYIREQDADVLCFQEFFESSISPYFDPNVSYITNKLKYPYHYFSVDNNWRGVQLGVAIFSRYPIVDSVRRRYTSFTGKRGESLIRVTLDMNGQYINIFTTHLQSFRFKGQDYQNIEILKRPEDNDKEKVVEAGKGIMYKFRDAYKYRPRQAEFVREQLDSSTHPTIIAGDFNDVPNSYTYSTVKADYQDAFIKKSAGLGRTFSFISPTLRIDYILADKNFEILQYKRDRKPYSDHYPLVADFKMK